MCSQNFFSCSLVGNNLILRVLIKTYHLLFIYSFLLYKIFLKSQIFRRCRSLNGLFLILSYKHRLYLILFQNFSTNLPIACKYLVVELSPIRSLAAGYLLFNSIQALTLCLSYLFFCFRNIHAYVYFTITLQYVSFKIFQQFRELIILHISIQRNQFNVNSIQLQAKQIGDLPSLGQPYCSQSQQSEVHYTQI